MKQIGGADFAKAAKAAAAGGGKGGGALGSITKMIGPAIAIIGVIVGLFFLLIALPAAPIIIYLSILFNVIKLMWEKLKAL
tara:strand:+ start:516 stop:758 length:243 start_codon:yes stop_codon:yes gene_type:complete